MEQEQLLEKSKYYLDMFQKGKRLYNLGKKEQAEFKTFKEQLDKLSNTCESHYSERQLGIPMEIPEEQLMIEQPQPNQIIITITADEIAVLSEKDNNTKFLLCLAEYIHTFMETH